MIHSIKAALCLVFFAISSAFAQEQAKDLVRFSNPTTMSQPKAYSHVAEVRGGRMVFLSGQIAQDRDGNVVGKGDIRTQTKQVFANIQAGLESVGATWANVVKMNTYLTDAAHIAAFREVREEVLASVKPRPASTAVVIAKLFGEDWLVEIEVVAVIPNNTPKRQKK